MNKPTFRIRTKEENKLIMDTMEADFGSNVLVAFKEYDFWIKEGKVKEVFTVPKESSDLITKISILEPYSAGIPIGSILSNSFHLEIEGAYMISNYTSKKITVKIINTREIITGIIHNFLFFVFLFIIYNYEIN